MAAPTGRLATELQVEGQPPRDASYHRPRSMTGAERQGWDSQEAAWLITFNPRNGSASTRGSTRPRIATASRSDATGDAFFVVLTTDSELHHYQVSTYGEVSYIGQSPLIRGHMDDPPPYWAGGDAAEK